MEAIEIIMMIISIIVYGAVVFCIIQWIKEYIQDKKKKEFSEWLRKHPEAKWHYNSETKSFIIMETKDYQKHKNKGKD